MRKTRPGFQEWGTPDWRRCGTRHFRLLCLYCLLSEFDFTVATFCGLIGEMAMRLWKWLASGNSIHPKMPETQIVGLGKGGSTTSTPPAMLDSQNPARQQSERHIIRTLLLSCWDPSISHYRCQPAAVEQEPEWQSDNKHLVHGLEHWQHPAASAQDVMWGAIELAIDVALVSPLTRASGPRAIHYTHGWRKNAHTENFSQSRRCNSSCSPWKLAQTFKLLPENPSPMLW